LKKGESNSQPTTLQTTIQGKNQKPKYEKKGGILHHFTGAVRRRADANVVTKTREDLFCSCVGSCKSTRQTSLLSGHAKGPRTHNARRVVQFMTTVRRKYTRCRERVIQIEKKKAPTGRRRDLKQHGGCTEHLR